MNRLWGILAGKLQKLKFQLRERGKQWSTLTPMQSTKASKYVCFRMQTFNFTRETRFLILLINFYLRSPPEFDKRQKSKTDRTIYIYDHKLSNLL